LGTLCIFIIIFLWAYTRYFHIVQPDNNEAFYDTSETDFNTYNQFYMDNISYFNKLDINGKYKFVDRSIELRKSIEIQTREDLNLTPEMEYFICGCLAQLTFGFKNPHIEMLKGVVLFPNHFYSRLVENWVKGLAMGNGVVFLSWYHFVEGYEYSRDTYNLGLHEFAHMLRMQTFSEGNIDSKFSNYFDEYNEIAMMSFINHRNGADDFFREYGSTNEAEFFSVCIENFFEIPDLFEAELPTLYYHLCYLLNQNPLNTTDNYTFDREDVKLVNKEVNSKIPEYEHIYSKHEKMFWEQATTINLFVFFVLILVAIGNGRYLYLFNISLLLIASSCIILLVRYLYFKNLKSILNYNYLVHFFKRVVPLLAIICFLFDYVILQ